MSQLTKGMYGTQHRSASELFGLRCGRMRGGPNRMLRNSGWFNKLGEKLGFGDIATDDVSNIAKGLDEDEVFIILREYPSFWDLRDLARQPGHEDLDIEAPGIEYVVTHAYYVIQRDTIWHLDRLMDHEITALQQLGVTCRSITHADLRALLIPA